MKEKEDISTLVKYNNEIRVSVWRNKNSVCNEIKSTTTFRPYVTPRMTFDVFSEDICRLFLSFIYAKNFTLNDYKVQYQGI
jgi:hypothetical protein